MQSTSRVFAQSSRDFASQKDYSRVRSTSRRNCSPLDSFYGNTLNDFDLLFINEEMNRKGSVAACFPRNVRIQSYKPWKVRGLETSAKQFLKENSCTVSGA